RPIVVDDDEVALRGGSLDRGDAGESLAKAVELCCDRLPRHLDVGPADLEAAVLTEPGRRAHADLDRELELLPGLRQVGHVQLRIADGREARLAERAPVALPQGVSRRTVER